MLFIKQADRLKAFTNLLCSSVDTYIIQPSQTLCGNLGYGAHRVLNALTVATEMLANDVYDHPYGWCDDEKYGRELPVQIQHVGHEGDNGESLTQHRLQRV